jgi:hypothetical protein
MSVGFFQGMPVRAEARARPTESDLTGVAGANCYVLREVVRDRLGASYLRTVRICEQSKKITAVTAKPAQVLCPLDFISRTGRLNCEKGGRPQVWPSRPRLVE